MSKRVLFAGLFHETHTFLDGLTSLEEFAILRGDEIRQCTGDSSPMGGALEAAKEFGWTVVPAVDFRAAPSATVADAVVEAFWSELVRFLNEPVDAVYLVLHGAMVSRSCTDVEGEILERLRRWIGPKVPVFGVFDLHANFSARMAEHANCLVAYRENPHADSRVAAQFAAELLQRTLTTGEVPRTRWIHPPLMWPPTGTATASDPMKVLEQRARMMERDTPAFWNISVCAGFSFADTPDTGVSFAITTTGSDEEADQTLHRLAQLALESKEMGNVVESSVEEIMARLDRRPLGLTVIVEPSDNIGGGAPGDGTGMLRALVEHGTENAAIAINDPDAVRQLSMLVIGATATVAIGGKGSRLDAGPLTLEVTIDRVGGGRFELEDKQSHLASMSGDFFDMGPCVVARHGGITILLTSRKTPPFDLGQWRSQGIEPDFLAVIVVKAAVAHRRAYDAIARRMWWVNTPGPCSSDLRSLPYRHIQRPLFPLDSI